MSGRTWLICVVAAFLVTGGTSIRAAADVGNDPSKTVVSGAVVDDSGQAVAGASVRVLGKTGGTGTTGKEGKFRIVVDNPRLTYSTLIAADADGRHFGYAQVTETESHEDVRLTLRPAADLTVNVSGREGPLADAEVYVIIDYAVFAGGRTDSAGNWTGRLPQGPRYWSIFARKSGVGFDYLNVGHPAKDAAPHPYPEIVELQLERARSVLVKTVDRSGRPIAGVAVGPWYVQVPGKTEDVNLSGASELWPKTGEDGTAVIDWLPERFVRAIPILAVSDDYYTPDQISIREEQPVGELSHTMLPLTTLSGRVTHPDGRPATGILVHAEGHGATHHYCRRYARTDPDGRYEMKVDTEMVYIVAVEEKEYAAPNITGLIVRAEEGPVADQDFVLGSGTVLRGRVTLGSDRRAIPDETITIIAEAGTVPKELTREQDRTYRPARLTRWTKTDAEGLYEVRLGAGEWSIRGPIRTEVASLSLPAQDAPAEITHDFHMPRPERGPLTVTVVDTDGKPVPKAKIQGRYASQQARRWFREAVSDDAGRLTTERSLDPLVLYAETDDRRRAGLVAVEAEATEAQVVVVPTASASGRLLDHEGVPMAETEIRYGIRVYLEGPGKGPFMDAFGGVAKSDAEGRYELSRLIPGQTYHASYHDEPYYRRVAEVTAKTAETIALGNTRLSPPPKPYVPPTPRDRVANAFSARADVPLNKRMAELLAEADREYTRPLLLLGRPDDRACSELFRLFYDSQEREEDSDESSKTPSDLRWEFELAALDLGRPEVRELPAMLGVEAEGSPAVLIVLTADGSAAASHPLVLSEEALDSRELTAFLLEHKLPTRNAEQMLAEALAKAKAENKRVFFIASASWCGPCRILARFLAPFKAELERHFVFVKLDVSRDEHGDAVRDRLQGDRDGGVPWYAILDADGNELATSNLSDQASQDVGDNIGFPSEAPGIEHFLSMLHQSAPDLGQEALDAMRAALEKTE